MEKPGENNIHNNAFYAEETLLRSELEAMRDCNPLTARHWIVSHLYLDVLIVPVKFEISVYASEWNCYFG